MRTLVLNSQNIVAGTGNSQLTYQFPAGAISLEQGDQLALSSVSMYNSVFNISAAQNNNKFNYTWTDGTVVNVTITDGFYDVDALNDFLHQQMLNNKHYLIEDSTGNFVWFITIQVNVSIYAIQIQCYPMSLTLYPTATGAGKLYTIPTGATWVNSTAAITPYLEILANSFRTTIGFNAGYYAGSTVGGAMTTAINTITGTTITRTQLSTYTTIQTLTSQNTAQITPLTSYLMTCTLINNNYSIPNTLLSAFPPSSAFAEQFVFAPNQMSFIDVQAGTYGSFTVQFFDQNLRQITMQDNQIVILLIVRNKNDKA